MNWAHALNIVYSAISYADKWVDEHDPVADIDRIVSKYLADYNLDDDVMSVVTTARDLLNAAAGGDTEDTGSADGS